VLRVDRLHLQNFRGFADATIDLDPGLTLLVANNGGGKTATLDALSIVLGSIVSSGIAKRLNVEPRISADDVRIIDIDRKYREPNFPVMLSVAGILNHSQATWGRELRGVRGNNTTVEAAQARAWGDEIVELTADRNQTHDVSLPVLAYYGTGRVHRELRTKKQPPLGGTSRLHAYSHCLKGDSNFKGMTSWITKAAFDREKGEQQWAPVLDGVYKAVESMLMSFDVIDVDVVLGLGGLALLTNSGWRSLDELSDGYRAVIALVADLAWRCGLLNAHHGASAPSESEGVVLVDELDMHLHPEWQARVLSDLRRTFPKLQFVVSTHSPFLAGSVESHQIRRLVSHPEGTMFTTIDTPTLGMSIEYLIATVLHGPQRSDVQPARDLADFGKAVATHDLLRAKELVEKVRATFSMDPDAVRILRQFDRLQEANAPH
jgi:predicted ATP-binding protein involved in virulence